MAHFSLVVAQGALKAEVHFLRSSAGWWQCLDLNPCLLVPAVLAPDTVGFRGPTVHWLFKSEPSVLFLLFFLNPLHLFFSLLFLDFSRSGGGARPPADSIPGLFWLPLLFPPRGTPAICAADQGVLLLRCLLKSMQAGVPRSLGRVEVGNEGIQGLHGVTWKERRAWRLSDSPRPSTQVTTASKLLHLSDSGLLDMPNGDNIFIRGL